MHATTPPLVALLLASTALAGCGSDKPKAFSIDGSVSVRGSDNFTDLDPQATAPTTCLTTGGYSNVAKGTQVEIVDASNKTVALGTLGEGRTLTDPTDSTATVCRFFFKVDSVPATSDFYEIRVAGRDGPKYKRTDLQGDTADLTLGP